MEETQRLSAKTVILFYAKNVEELTQGILCHVTMTLLLSTS